MPPQFFFFKNLVSAFHLSPPLHRACEKEQSSLVTFPCFLTASGSCLAESRSMAAQAVTTSVSSIRNSIHYFQFFRGCWEELIYYATLLLEGVRNGQEAAYLVHCWRRLTRKVSPASCNLPFSGGDYLKVLRTSLSFQVSELVQCRLHRCSVLSPR